MKTNFYTHCIIIILSVGLIFMYYKVSNLEYKYETFKESNIRLETNQKLTESQVKERQFKEEMYIRQQERDTNLILTVFSLFSLLVGFLTFKSVRESFVHVVREFDKNHSRYKSEMNKKYVRIAHDYKLLEKDLNFEIALNLLDRVKDSLKDNDKSSYVGYSLRAIEKLINVTYSYEDESPEHKDAIKRLILSTVKSLNENIETETNVIIGQEVYKKRIQVISDYLISYLENYREFSEAVSKIKIS